MTLHTGFLYQVAVDVRPFQCRFSICGLTKCVTGNQPAPTAVLFSFFKEAHLFFFRCESASDWTPVFKSVRESAVAASEQIFHHCLHKFFFSKLDDCSRSRVYKISTGIWVAALNSYNWGRLPSCKKKVCFQACFCCCCCCGLQLKWPLIIALLSIVIPWAVFFSSCRTSFTNHFIKASLSSHFILSPHQHKTTTAFPCRSHKVFGLLLMCLVAFPPLVPGQEWKIVWGMRLTVAKRKEPKTSKSKLMEYEDTVPFLCEQRKEKCHFNHIQNVLLEIKQESFLLMIKLIYFTPNRWLWCRSPLCFMCVERHLAV